LGGDETSHAQLMFAVANHGLREVSDVEGKREGAPDIPVGGPDHVRFNTGYHDVLRINANFFVAFAAHKNGRSQDEVRAKKAFQEKLTVDDFIAIAEFRSRKNARFLAVADADTGAKRVSDAGMFFQQFHVALQDIRLPQIIVRGNNPDIFAAAQPEAFIFIAKKAQVPFVAGIADSRVVKGLGHLRRVVRGAIVHDQQFEIAVGLRKDRANAFRKK